MQSGQEMTAALKEVLGYLNFSSGASDPRFLRNFNALFRYLAAESDGRPIAQRLSESLYHGLEELPRQEGAFADTSQARAVLCLLLEHLLPAYHEHHRDLLFHQQQPDFCQPFLLGRMIEAILSQGPPWDERRRIVSDALGQLNDFIGYRPVAVVESNQKIEPYRHEWVRPVPLHIEGAGVAVGIYEGLITSCLAILRETDPQLLTEAHFDLDALEELALDPRAYDFDHPVNKRPNYHFGMWDPHSVDNKGRYRRFVVQQVALDALLARVNAHGDASRDELLNEAATVLAGTMLMASGTSGSGPDTHDSTTTLSTLLPRIASYRDRFYEFHLGRLTGPAAKRLVDEAAKLKQPFGGARQHLNQELARRRAKQLQHVHLAQLFARMGYPEAATRQAETVQVASARMLCQMYCRLTLGHRAIDRRDLPQVVRQVEEIENLLNRAIECGALVDPWNIVGFGGNFSLFPAIENSIHDYRVDTLIELVEQIFALGSRAWSEAAARDDRRLEAELAGMFERLANWWDKFATPAVESLRRVVGKEQQISTNLVAGALSAWNKAGAAAGDVAFWRMFVDQFDSPKAFQLVVEALLEKRDRVASMALLMQWLSEGERIGLEDGDSSFHQLAQKWLTSLATSRDETGADEGEANWPLVRKFFDYLEANADIFWQVPALDLSPRSRRKADDWDDELDESRDARAQGEEEGDEGEVDGQLYRAAYEEMTYRDSTDDGFEGGVFDPGSQTTEFELEHEAKRLGQRLSFLATLARLYKMTAIYWGAGARPSSDHRDAFAGWHATTKRNAEQLLGLLDAVHQYRQAAPSGTHDSLVEYDRRRLIKEGLLEKIVATAVETIDAARTLCAASGEEPTERTERSGILLIRAILAGDVNRILQLWASWKISIQTRPILYVPLSRGGEPAAIVQVRSTQKMFRDLLSWLPRLGLIRETCDLLAVAQAMETHHPVGPGAVTEFDRLFESGYRGIVENIVASSASWQAGPAKGQRTDFTNPLLVECLKQLTESQLKRWLEHSRTLRLSVVERLAGEKEWKGFVEFVKNYGGDVFTQRFLNLGNLRAILHQGVEAWLEQLRDENADEVDWRLLDDLDGALPRETAAKYLTIALEAVVENYSEYRDYNSTTTQSDRGDMLFTLVDFLRLRTEYDRVAWNLRPVVLAHEIVVREGRTEAAELWRRELVERTSDVADRHLRRLHEMCQMYGMRLPTVADRIGERFVRPLLIDRVRSLVRPAMEEASGQGSLTSFSVLEQEIVELAREPTGVGFDIPTWLEALEIEVAAVRSQQRNGGQAPENFDKIPRVRLALEELQDQLDEISASDE